LKHAQDAIAGRGCGKMLECMATHNVESGKDRPVESFKELGEHVETNYQPEIARSRISPRKQERQQDDKR
jgi:hypothetical protein